MFALALSALTPFIPLPEGSAVLLGHAIVKSEDGKQAVQLATFGFPMSKRDGELLGSIMNSDPYWHHFRMRAVYLAVGEKVFTGGPRLTAWDWSGLLRRNGPPPKYGWTTAFVLPADVKLTGELTFSFSDGNDKPAAEPFARIELTEKDVAAAAVPFRATIKETGKYNDPLDDNMEMHYVVFVPSHFVPFDDLRMGEAKPRRFPYDIYFGPGKGYRASRPDEFAATFEDAPPADAAVRLKFRGAEGWYRAETVIEKPKEKK